jgi:hypothetical protein
VLTKIKNNNIIITESKIKKGEMIKMMTDWEIRKEFEKQKQEVKNTKKLIDSYKTLRKFGCVKLEFNAYDGDIYNLLALIRNLESWNNFDGYVVANRIEKLFEELPKRNYGENNPNNGKPQFDKIEIIGDSEIIFKAFRLSPFEENTKKEIKRMVNTYGGQMKADEIEFLEEPIEIGEKTKSYTYYIRFWWD